MALIEDRERALKLARAILADITLYNRDKIAAGGDLTPELEEGRALFRSRVSPDHHDVYEDAVGAWTSGEQTEEQQKLEEKEAEGRRVWMFLALILLVFVAGSVSIIVMSRNHGEHGSSGTKHEGTRR